MVRTRKGKFVIALAIFGALLLAVWFVARSEFWAGSEPTVNEIKMDKSGLVHESDESAATLPADVDGASPTEQETVGPPPLKKTTLLQRVSRRKDSGEVVIVLEAGDEVEVVALRGTRIYVRIPIGETIGIPVEATDWVIQEDEDIDR